MKWQNKVQLIGYLGKDPAVYPLPKGGYCAVLSLATNDGFTREGQIRETFWHTIKIWGRNLAHIQQQFMTGSHVLVEGELVYRFYQDTNGHYCSRAEIRAANLVNLDR